MAGRDWSDQENDLTVADYCAMRQDDLLDQPYSKAEHNRQLQTLAGRGRGSIEFKHQKISAVLKGLGEAWIEGRKPAMKFQMSLVDAVICWLSSNPGWITHAPILAPLRHMNVALPLRAGLL